MDGANSDPEFQNRLRVMDVDPTDLEQLFYMVDADGGGTIDQEEFTGTLSRWMVNDSKTAARFVKHNIQSVLHEQTKLQEALGRLLEQVNDLRESQDYLGSMQGVFVEEQRTMNGAAPLKYRTGNSKNLSPILAERQSTSPDRPTSLCGSQPLSREIVSPGGNGESFSPLQPLQCVLDILKDDMKRLEITIENITLNGTNSNHFNEVHARHNASESVFKDSHTFELLPEVSIQV